MHVPKKIQKIQQKKEDNLPTNSVVCFCVFLHILRSQEEDYVTSENLSSAEVTMAYLSSVKVDTANLRSAEVTMAYLSLVKVAVAMLLSSVEEDTMYLGSVVIVAALLCSSEEDTMYLASVVVVVALLRQVETDTANLRSAEVTLAYLSSVKVVVTILNSEKIVSLEVTRRRTCSAAGLLSNSLYSPPSRIEYSSPVQQTSILSGHQTGSYSH